VWRWNKGVSTKVIERQPDFSYDLASLKGTAMLKFLSPRRSLLTAATALLIAGLPAAEALAHAEFKTSSPAANSVVAAPASLSITFSEEITLKFSGATITGPDKDAVKTGPGTLNAKTHSVLTVPITDTLKPGKYTVDWHNLSTDGHKLTGNFAFTVK
jgi:copper resistance protein C